MQDGPTAVLTGTPVVPGVAYGPAVQVTTSAPEPEARKEVAPEQRAEHAHRFDEAARAVAGRLRERAGRAAGAAAEVLQATAAMAEDRGWRAAVHKSIGEGNPASCAVWDATTQFISMFEKAGGLMAERVTDLKDVRDRVTAGILGAPEPGVPDPGEPSVLVADDLAPADTAGLDPASIIGLVTERGGPTSHTAIIARQLGIPCAVAVQGAAAVESGTRVLLDGESGRLLLEPDAEAAQHRLAQWRTAEEAARRWCGPGATADGYPVALLANVQDGASAEEAAEGPAEGVGLLRTELAFLDRDAEPTVEEQAVEYRRVLTAFPEKKVVVRTLDAGSDKPLRFIGHVSEENPALGVRGIRVAEQAPGILTRQLDAIAAATDTSRVAVGAVPMVMAPMVATVGEAREFARAVRDRGMKAGVMIEVPSAALLADRILAEVDFVSIGTNDLTQYVMAADRMAPALAGLTDPWQPAVLALVAAVATAGSQTGKPVGVCGEAAADPALACVLVGLGVTSLSAAPAAIRPVGAALAANTRAACEAAATAALGAADPEGAREAARSRLA